MARRTLAQAALVLALLPATATAQDDPLPTDAPASAPASQAASPVVQVTASAQPYLQLQRRPAIRFQTVKARGRLTLLGKATGLAYAPDGRTHVLFSNPAQIVAPTGRFSLARHHSLFAAAFSRDSSRVAMLGTTVEPTFSIFDIKAGKLLHFAIRRVPAAAFVRGDPDRLAYVNDTERGELLVLERAAPFTAAPRVIRRLKVRSWYGNHARFSLDGRRVFLYESTSDSFFEVELETGKTRQVRLPERASLVAAPDGSRVCWQGAKTSRCLRTADLRVETIADCSAYSGHPRLDGSGRRLMIECSGKYQLADLTAGTVSELSGVRLHRGGGVDLSAGGSGVSAGSSTYFDFFDLRRRQFYRVFRPNLDAGELYATHAVPGLPDAIAVGGENDTFWQLFLFTPP
jgi:hypothetical protein